MHRLLAHLLLALHHRASLLLLHHRALPLYLLTGLRLLCGLRAFALLRLHLRLPLPLHLLLTRAQLRGLFALRLHARLLDVLLAFALLRLFLKLAPLLLFTLSGLDFGWTLLRGRAIAGGLRRALDRPHHGQARRLGRVALRFVCGPDHRGARQGPAFTRMRETRARQFAPAPDGLRRQVARGYWTHRVLERFCRACTAGGGRGRPIARRRFGRARGRGAAERVRDGRHQFDTGIARR